MKKLIIVACLLSLCRLALAIDPAYVGNAGALTNSPGRNIIYVSPWGSDTTNGFSFLYPVATPMKALELASDGFTIHLMAGTYNIGTNNLLVPDGVTLEGEPNDPSLSVIFGYADVSGVELGYSTTGGPQVHPGNNSIIRNLTIQCDTNNLVAHADTEGLGPGDNRQSGTWSGLGTSYLNPPANAGFSNVLVQNVKIIGAYFDCFHQNSSNRCSATYINCCAQSDGGDGFSAVCADPVTVGYDSTNSDIVIVNFQARLQQNAIYTTFAAAGIGIGGPNIITAGTTPVLALGVKGTNAEVSDAFRGVALAVYGANVKNGLSLSSGASIQMGNFAGAQSLAVSNITASALKFRLNPSAGYVLTSDARGNGTWQPPGTGSGGSVALIDAPTIATDASLGTYFRVTLGGNRTLGNPTNPRDSERLTWEIIQDGTGNRTLTMDTKFAFGTDVTGITLTTNANKRDFITAIYNSATDRFYVLSPMRGY